MNNKILLGSIIAVVILVLVSFTGVVGYQTTKSNSGKVSPLFNMRTSRAIDEESKDFTSDYVGKGEENDLSIPKRNTNGNLPFQALNRIKRMDRDTIKRVLEKFMNNRDIFDGEVIPTQSRINPMIMNNINNSHFKADNFQTGMPTGCSSCGDTYIDIGGWCLSEIINYLFLLCVVTPMEIVFGVVLIWFLAFYFLLWRSFQTFD